MRYCILLLRVQLLYVKSLAADLRLVNRNVGLKPTQIYESHLKLKSIIFHFLGLKSILSWGGLKPFKPNARVAYGHQSPMPAPMVTLTIDQELDTISDKAILVRCLSIRLKYMYEYIAFLLITL